MMIVVDLTSQEAWAHEQCGTMSEREAHDFWFIEMICKGVSHEEAEATARSLSQSLALAHGKIESARQYAVRVVK